MEHEPTLRDVLEAINTFADHSEDRWRDNEKRWQKAEERFERIDAHLHRIDVKLEKMDATLDKVVSQTMEIQEWRAEVTPKLARL